MHTIENPPIPFSYPINGGMDIGSELVFTGATYHGERKRFHINLKGDGGDNNIALHFNPRFKFLDDIIVLNSCTYAGWGTEERHRNKLKVGDQFRIRIVCHHSHFVLFVNDKELARYEHRLAPQMVRGLEVDGDVALQRIQMINFPQSQVPQPYVPSPAPQPPYVPSPPQPHAFPTAPPPMGAGVTEPHYPYLKPNFVPPPSAWGPPAHSSQQQPYQNPAPNDYGFRNPSPNHYCPNCSSRGCYQCRH